MVIRSKLLEEIRAESLIDIIPGMDELLLQHGQLRLAEPGEILCESGAPINKYLMPVSSSLKIAQQEYALAESPTGYIQKYRSIALRELLQGAPYPYTVICEQKTNILELDKDIFLSHMTQYPKIERYLKLVTTCAGCRSFKEFLEESALSVDKIVELFARIELEPKRLNTNETLDNHQQFISFISSGKIRIESRPQVTPPFSLVLGEGAFLGGEALVAPFETSYTFKAEEPTIVHVLPLQYARALCETYNVSDKLFDEPWIKIQNRNERRSQRKRFTLLPGQPLSEEAFVELGVAINPTEFSSCLNDFDSYGASLKNIATLHGIPINASRIESHLVKGRIISPIMLATLLEEVGFITQNITTSVDLLPNQHMPTLTTFGPRLVILQTIRADGSAILLDPANGFIEVAAQDFGAHWGGTIIETLPNVYHDTQEQDTLQDKEPVSTEAREASSKTKQFSTFLRAFWPFRTQLLNILGLTLLTLGLGVVLPQFAQNILDEALSLRNVPMLIAMGVGLILCTLLNILVSFVSGWISLDVETRYNLRIGNLFVRKALSLPEKFFAKQKVGEILSLLSEMGQIREFLGNNAISILVNLASLVIYSVILWMYSWKITMLGFGLLIALLVTVFTSRRKLQQNYEAAFEASKEASSLVAEQLAAVSSIKAAGAEEIMRSRWEAAFVRGVEYRRRLQLQNTAIGSFVGFLQAATKIGALWIAASLAVKGTLTPGSVMAVVMYLENMTFPMLALAGVLIEYLNVEISAQKVNRVFDAESEEPAHTAAVKHSIHLRGKIKLDRVNFRYSEKSDWVLKDISVRIYPKQVVAIVGRSGCGKTTLANLIAGSITPTTGRIYFDDFDSTFLSLSSLRHQIGYIMQENQLFAGSIAENIAYRDDALDYRKIGQSAKEASAIEFIAKMPTQFDSYLAEEGMGLSGGQKQRLSIARTLYTNPRILIMDEATSALDAESERAIIDNMKQILQGRTAIIIAHRLSTIQNADRILVMDQGNIVEEGTHTELLARGGFYAELFENQANIG